MEFSRLRNPGGMTARLGLFFWNGAKPFARWKMVFVGSVGALVLFSVIHDRGTFLDDLFLILLVVLLWSVLCLFSFLVHGLKSIRTPIGGLVAGACLALFVSGVAAWAFFERQSVGPQDYFKFLDSGTFISASGRWSGSDQAWPLNAVEIEYSADKNEVIVFQTNVASFDDKRFLASSVDHFEVTKVDASEIRAENLLYGYVLGDHGKAEIVIDRINKRVHFIKIGASTSSLNLFLDGKR